MRTENSTNFDITVRRQAVLRIVTELKRKNLEVNRYTVQEALKNAGFDVDVSTVYRDITSINRENTWVRDLAESNYSDYQESIHNTLNWVEAQAKKQFKRKWTQSKKVVRQVLSKEGDVMSLDEITVTGEVAGAKAGFLNIIAKVQDLKIKHTNGENINISAALISQEFKDLKEKYKENGIDLESPVNVIELAKKARQ